MILTYADTSMVILYNVWGLHNDMKNNPIPNPYYYMAYEQKIWKPFHQKEQFWTYLSIARSSTFL